MTASTSTIQLKSGIAFAVFMGVLATLFKYYYFGLVNIDMFPVVMREIDPDFLPNDHYTNGLQAYSEDFVFAKIVASITAVFSLPITLFTLTGLSNIGIAVVTFFTCRDLANRNNLAGMMGALLIVTTATFQWGNRDFLFRYDLTPEHLIMPLILAAIWMGIRGRILMVGLLAGLATFVHPLTGPGIGGLTLVSILISRIQLKEANGKTLAEFFGSCLMLLAPLLLHLIPYAASISNPIDENVFIDIMVLRFPHHYLPSHFLTAPKVFIGVTFLTAGWLCWRSWKNSNHKAPSLTFSVYPISVLLIILCMTGWIFSEIIPSRFIFTLHPFRFLTILKFLGSVFIAIWIAIRMDQEQSWVNKASLVIGGLFPPLLIAQHFVRIERKHYKIVALAASLMVVWLVRDFNRSEYIPFMIGIALIFFATRSNTRLYGAIGLVMIGLIIKFTLLNHVTLPPKIARLNSKYFQPIVFPEDLQDSEAQMAKFMRQHTPKTSQFLVPPRQGRLRVLAERALIVDGSAIPMNDIGLREWWQRFNDVYNFNLREPLKHMKTSALNYSKLSDQDVTELQERYGFEYVVGFADQKTEFPVVYNNEHFKLIQIPSANHEQ